MIKVHYRTKEGDFMDMLGINEIDLNSDTFPNVYRVEHNSRTFENKKAREYLTGLINEKQNQI